MSKTFCILPWIHLSTRPNGHMRVCCTANASSAGPTPDKKYGGEVGIVKNDDGKPANFNHTNLTDAWNNTYMRTARTMMRDGEVPASCTKCFKEEAAGHHSKRMWETAYWEKEGFTQDWALNSMEDDGTIEPNIPYIDLRFGTKCNLKCIMCSPHDSSMWIPDWNKLYPKIENENLKDSMQWNNKGNYDGASYNWHMNNPEFWEQLYEQVPNMKQLYFAGGESLIIDAHYELLEECIKRGHAKNIELRYNSNGVEWRDDLFDLWEEFRHVRFHYSVDSIGAMNDYIRYPSEWNRTEEVFHILDNTSDKVEITVACAVQVLNIFYLPDFIKWKMEQNFKKINMWPFSAGMINYHFVYHPAHLNVKILPQWFKDKCEQKYEEFYPWLENSWELSGAPDKQTFLNAPYGIERLKGMISFMNSEDWSVRLPEFQEYIKHMDEIRETDFVKVFPEMSGLLDND